MYYLSMLSQGTANSSLRIFDVKKKKNIHHNFLNQYGWFLLERESDGVALNKKRRAYDLTIYKLFTDHGSESKGKDEKTNQLPSEEAL